MTVSCNNWKCTVKCNKLIVALDVESAAKARRLVNTLRGMVGMFKIGSQLFTAAGPPWSAKS